MLHAIIQNFSVPVLKIAFLLQTISDTDIMAP